MYYLILLFILKLLWTSVNHLGTKENNVYHLMMLFIVKLCFSAERSKVKGNIISQGCLLDSLFQ